MLRRSVGLVLGMLSVILYDLGGVRHGQTRLVIGNRWPFYETNSTFNDTDGQQMARKLTDIP